HVRHAVATTRRAVRVRGAGAGPALDGGHRHPQARRHDGGPHRIGRAAFRASGGPHRPDRPRRHRGKLEAVSLVVPAQAGTQCSNFRVETDVLVVGAGAAGMYAAIAAARGGARVLLVDRSLIGRGGATVMAQMTVAVAVGEEEPDHWEHHLADTLKAGRGLCNEPLAQLLCEDGPECIRAMDDWGVGWARKDGRIVQAMAPGHDRPRCVYVDFLNTGPAVSK